MGWFIHSHKNQRRAEFQRKPPPPPQPQLAASPLRTPTPGTQSERALATDLTALRKTGAGVGRSRDSWSVKWFEGTVSVRSGEWIFSNPTIKSMPALPYGEHGRGRHRPDLSKAAKWTTWCLGVERDELIPGLRREVSAEQLEITPKEWSSTPPRAHSQHVYRKPRSQQ